MAVFLGAWKYKALGCLYTSEKEEKVGQEAPDRRHHTRENQKGHIADVDGADQGYDNSDISVANTFTCTSLWY